MKTITFLTLALGLSAVGAYGANNDSDKAATIDYLEPDRFTDFKITRLGGEKEQKQLQQQLNEAIERIAEHYLPPAYHLTLRFRDIDMAGDFEPQRGPDADDVRIIRAVYPPRFTVEYEVRDPNGEVVASGSRRITDLSFQNIVSFRRDEQLFYETELVRDLIRDITREF